MQFNVRRGSSSNGRSVGKSRRSQVTVRCRRSLARHQVTANVPVCGSQTARERRRLPRALLTFCWRACAGDHAARPSLEEGDAEVSSKETAVWEAHDQRGGVEPAKRGDKTLADVDVLQLCMEELGDMLAGDFTRVGGDSLGA